MKPQLRRPVKIFWAVFFFVSFVCASVSLVMTVSQQQPINGTEVAVQAGIAVVAAVMGGALIRKPRF